MNSPIHGRQPRRHDLPGLSGDSSSGTGNGGATVWTPACYACSVRGKCSQERGGRAPLLCGARGCTACHGRREALEEAVQADAGLCATAVGLGGKPDDDEDGRLRGLCYPWEQDTLRIAGPLDDVPVENLEQPFATVVRVQPRLATAHAKLFTHVLGLLSHTLGEHRPNRQSETPNSLLRAIKLGISCRLCCTRRTTG